jgi:molybdopterin-guanine dinucleotide biosynthesis protein MobB
MVGSREGQPPGPTVVAVLGLKNTGKTTAAAALISGLSARGFRVAAVKSSHLPRLDLDPRGRDSRQLYEAGAECVVAQTREETLMVRRHDRPALLPDLLALMPPNLDFLIMEGGPAQQADVVFLCLRSLSELEETLEVREVPVDRVRALTGAVAALPLPEAAGNPEPHPTEAPQPGSTPTPARGSVRVRGATSVPLLTAADAIGREGLIELALAARAQREDR